MKFISYNRITNALSISASSINLEYPYENIFDNYGSQVFKFTGYSDEWIMFDAGSGNTIEFDALGLGNHNITSGATITIMGNATDSWASPSYSQTLTWAEGVIYALLPDFNYRFLRIRFQNSTVDPIQFGILQAGPGFVIPNILAEIDTEEILEEEGFISGSGNADGVINFSARSFDFNAREISESVKQAFINILRERGTNTPFIGAIWENNFALETPLYFKFTAIGKPKKIHYKWQFSFSIREVY